MVAKKTKKAVKKTDKAKVTKKTTNKAVKKEEINSTEKTSQKSSGKKCSSDSSNTGNMCKTEAIYLAAGVVIGILIMFAYTQINPLPATSVTDDDLMTLKDAETIIRDIINNESANPTTSVTDGDLMTLKDAETIIMYVINNAPTDSVADTNLLSLSEAEAVVLDVVKMDPNLEMLNVTPSIINSSESNGMYSVNVKLSGPQGDTTFNSYITKDGMKINYPLALRLIICL